MAPGVGGAEVEPQQRRARRFAVGPEVLVQKKLLQLLIGQFVHVDVPELVLLRLFLGLGEDDEVSLWSVGGGRGVRSSSGRL